jgi:hypothetical protein
VEVVEVILEEAMLEVEAAEEVLDHFLPELYHQDQFQLLSEVAEQSLQLEQLLNLTQEDHPQLQPQVEEEV